MKIIIIEAMYTEVPTTLVWTRFQDKEFSFAQDHTVQRALRWPSRQRGTKEVIQVLLEKILYVGHRRWSTLTENRVSWLLTTIHVVSSFENTHRAAPKRRRRGNRNIMPIFVAASHQTRLDTRSKARRPIKVGIKGRGRSGRSRDSNPACLCCSSAHLVQCEPDEASSFTNPNVGPGTYASLRLKLDAWSSAVQGGQRRQKCSSPTRR